MFIIKITQTRKRNKSAATHPNVLEFTRASKDGRLIRQAFCSVMNGSRDCLSSGKLTQALMKVIQSDNSNDWGKRTVHDGDLQLLQGFEFNGRKEVRRILKKSMETSINAVTGFCRVAIDSLLPMQDLCYEANYAYVRFTAAAATFDFQQENCIRSVARTDYLPFDKRVSIALMPMVNIQDGCPVLLLLGIEFFGKINGFYYPIRTGGSLALQIVQVDRGVVAD